MNPLKTTINEFKDFKDLPKQPKKSPDPVKSRQKISLYHPLGKEKVVDGDIKWKPIDVVAARVVSKAPWWAEPPQPEPNMTPEFSEPARVKTKKRLNEDGYAEEYIDTVSLAPAAVDEHNKTVKNWLKTSDELTGRAKELVDTVKYLSSEMQGPWAEYQKFIKASLAEIREERIAFGSEIRLLMSGLKEVRQFFLEDSYETQINRLHEFVDLCERLKALKETGFLDAVSDTILKLSE